VKNWEIFTVFGRRREFKVDMTICRDVLGIEYGQLADFLPKIAVVAMRRSNSCHVFGVRGEEEHPKEIGFIPSLFLFVKKCELCWI